MGFACTLLSLDLIMMAFWLLMKMKLKLLVQLLGADFLRKSNSGDDIFLHWVADKDDLIYEFMEHNLWCHEIVFNEG
ncbi:hypothetical protein SAMN02745752_02440 [Marinospirillum alkaliphilum DSM 21637]|uniref:Uncharacterized protein n=1 Tax=Marinospirillum alkaliphilum DSM 21637 TaxID=1122209 RepID=A0A1K1YX02_9GAMM|nr:hypothetical protein SAMN02745752_02440 [Marinospirillum alkaliphilum DSM 21637]